MSWGVATQNGVSVSLASIVSISCGATEFSPASLFTSGVAGAWYDPSDVLLNWRTNLLTYSQEFDNAAWTKNAATVTANAVTAPDGTTTADKLIPSTAVSQHFVSSPDIAAGTYTWSAYFKSAGYTKAAISCYDGVSYKAATLFDLSSGTVVSSAAGSVSTITDSGNGWYRCTVTATLAAASGFGGAQFRPNIGGSAVSESVAGNGTDGVYIWGAQLELGSTATTYQPITTPEQTYLTYDPQPVLYQDSAGTTPVTAVEQPVGLMLDKSQGLVLGSELVTNGDFSGGTTGWTATDSQAVVSGELEVSGASATKWSYQIVTTVVGRSYQVGGTRRGGTGSAILWVGTSSGANSLGATSTVAAGVSASNQLVFTATTTTTYIQLLSSGAGLTAYFDNISVKSLAGNHARQATPTSCPILRARYNQLTYSEQFDNAAWGKSGLNISGTPAWVNVAVAPDGTTTAEFLIPQAVANNHSVNSAASVTVAGVNTFSVYAKAGGLNYLQMLYGAGSDYANFNLTGAGSVTQNSGGAPTITAVGSGWYRCTITSTLAGATTVYLQPIPTGTETRYATYLGDATNGIYIWGAQLAYGSSAGTYQRIAAATDYATAGFLPYLAFDGVDDVLIATPASADYILNSVAFGAQYNALSGNGTLGSIGNSATGNSFSYINENSGTSVFNASARNDAATTVSNYIGTPDLLPHVLISIWNASASSIQNNSSIVTGSALTGAMTVNKFALGALGRSTNTTFGNSRIYSALFISPALTTAQSASLASYIAAKSGVTL